MRQEFVLLTQRTCVTKLVPLLRLVLQRFPLVCVMIRSDLRGFIGANRVTLTLPWTSAIARSMLDSVANWVTVMRVKVWCGWCYLRSERVAPGVILVVADLTILAQIISKVIPILTGISYITAHNTLMLIAEDVECLLFGHCRWVCVDDQGSFPPPDEPNIDHLECCGWFCGQFSRWHKV